jgi:SPP1 gp7 family putative phage head morphogenesis protein
MADPLVVQLANQYRLDLIARNEVQMDEMRARWQQVEEALFEQIELLVESLAERNGERPTRSQLYQMERYQALLAQLELEMARYQQEMVSLIDQQQALYAKYGAEDALALLRISTEGAGVSLSFNRLNPAAVENVVALARAGNPLAELLEAAYPASANKMTEALIEGVALGWNPRETARAMAEGLTKGRDHILLVARDQQLRAYRMASQQQYRASGVVTRYRRLAAKQARTCAACLALDGKEYLVGDLMELHPQDRCTMIPVVEGMPAIQWESGEAWFNRQDEATQRDILGKEYWQAWSEGKFEFSQLATIKENTIWGPNVQVTPLKHLLAA